MIYGLTQLGVVHTAISLVAVFAALIALLRDKEISPATVVGKVYVVATVLTCVSSLGIFQHGGFGKPHALAIITLIVLAGVYVAYMTPLFGRFSRYVQVVGLSATFLFHWIPAVTETTTRLPLGAPLLSSPDAPELKIATGVLGLLFLIGAALQVQHLRAKA
jgi:uncharacterized membrane protein